MADSTNPLLHSPEAAQWTKDVLIRKANGDKKGYQVTARFTTADGQTKIVRMSTESEKLKEVCELVESLRQVSLTLSSDRFEQFFGTGVKLQAQKVSYEGGSSNLLGLVRIEGGIMKDVAARMDRDAKIQTFLVEHVPGKTKQYFTVNLDKATEQVKGGRLHRLIRYSNQPLPFMSEKMGVVTTGKHIEKMADFWGSALNDKQPLFNADDWNREVADRVQAWQQEGQLSQRSPVFQEVPMPIVPLTDLTSESLEDQRDEVGQAVRDRKGDLATAKRLNAGPASIAKAEKELQLAQAQQVVVHSEILGRNLQAMSNRRADCVADLSDRLGGGQGAGDYLNALAGFMQSHSDFRQQQAAATRAIQTNVARQIELSRRISDLEARPQPLSEIDKRDLTKLKAERSMREVQLNKLMELSALAMKIADAMILLPAGSPARAQLDSHLGQLVDSIKKTVNAANGQPNTAEGFGRAKAAIKRATEEVSGQGFLHLVATQTLQAKKMATDFHPANGEIPSMVRLLGGRVVPSRNIIEIP